MLTVATAFKFEWAFYYKMMKKLSDDDVNIKKWLTGFKELKSEGLGTLGVWKYFCEIYKTLG